MYHENVLIYPEGKFFTSMNNKSLIIFRDEVKMASIYRTIKNDNRCFFQQFW